MRAATFVTLAAALALFAGSCHSSRLGLAHVISPRIVSTGLFFMDLRVAGPVFVAQGRTSIEQRWMKLRFLSVRCTPAGSQVVRPGVIR